LDEVRVRRYIEIAVHNCRRIRADDEVATRIQYDAWKRNREILNRATAIAVDANEGECGQVNRNG
jgi:hypothetical protein